MTSFVIGEPCDVVIRVAGEEGACGRAEPCSYHRDAFGRRTLMLTGDAVKWCPSCRAAGDAQYLEAYASPPGQYRCPKCQSEWTFGPHNEPIRRGTDATRL